MIVFTISAWNTGTDNIPVATVELKIFGPDGGLAASPSRSISSFLSGSERTVKITYNLPRSASLGLWKYEVYLYGHVRSRTLMDSETGRSFTVEPAIVTGDIVSIADAPDPVARRGTATFTVKIKSTGNIIWPNARITVNIYRAGGKIPVSCVLSVMNILPGPEYTFNIQWRVPPGFPAGTYNYDRSLLALLTHPS